MAASEWQLHNRLEPWPLSYSRERLSQAHHWLPGSRSLRCACGLGGHPVQPPHFTDEEATFQGEQGARPRSHSGSGGKIRAGTGAPGSGLFPTWGVPSSTLHHLILFRDPGKHKVHQNTNYTTCTCTYPRSHCCAAVGVSHGRETSPFTIYLTPL